MLTLINRMFFTLTTAAVLTAAGCSDGGNSTFVYGPGTRSLMREAQEGFGGDLPGVKQHLDVRFGNPQQVRFWSKLPLNAGGLFGSVAAPPESGAIKQLQLRFDEPPEAFDDSAHLLQFVTGAAATSQDLPEVVTVVSWDPKTGTALLDDKMATAPAEGDRVILDGGTVLRSGRALYQRHCSHCHGTSGDGAGPTAEYLTPRPRDYRNGVFKFTSTQGPEKASRDDLERILRNGIPGTYMPSFVPMLSEVELDHVVEYIRFLAMRGEFERRLVSELSSDYSRDAVSSRTDGGETRKEIVDSLKDVLGEEINDALEFVGDSVADAWEAAESEDVAVIPSIPRVPDTIESRRIGRELFLSKEVACADCHGISGQGNGPQSTVFEKNPVTEELYNEPGLHDIWDNLNQPRNLTYGIYRGGRRPIDLFRRVHAGIKGTRMPSFKNLEQEKIWHLVNYVLSVPFEVDPGRAAPAE
ncbi:MAG: c-type cytochrome [Fuerstiella sp.]|nr:c-type cytochrome [Fuerstiella sp.]